MLDQAEAVLKSAEGTPLHAYPDAVPPVPASIMVWRSVRAGGDTKTEKSRRTLALPKRCVDALIRHRERQIVARKAAGPRWKDHDLVFASAVGTELDAHNVRRAFRKVLKKAGLNEKEWTPPGDATQFRLAALRQRGADREHLSSGWSQQHEGDRDRLSEAASAGPRRRCRSDGRSLPAVVAQLVTQKIKEAGPAERNRPLAWWSYGDLNPRPLRCERSALPDCAIAPMPRLD